MIRRILALSGTIAVLAVSALPARSAPVCHVAGTVPEADAACGFRIFPEVALSASFIQHDGYGGLVAGEYELGIKALATRFPNFVKVNTLAELLDDPEAVSYDGRDIWVIEVTDFREPEEGKEPVVVSLSVHGLEKAGIEGGVRYAEDLARWATSDPTHILRNGTDADSVGITVRDALKKTHLYLSNINPDGWAAGDVHNGGVYTRGNGNGNTLPTGGVDLNRQFPTKGWVQTSGRPLPQTQPEAIAWATFVESLSPTTAADLHGELTSVNNAFADMMYPAGQWDPLMQDREEALARHMKSNVARYFDEHGIVLGDVAGAALGMRPADYATAYDVVDYDDSGFMGDFFASTGAVEMDVEHFLSHLVPNSAWTVPLEQAHVAAVRAEIETLMVEAIVTGQRDLALDLGNAGYVFDPTIITDADGYGGPPPPAGVVPESYSVTPMRYFEDLSTYASQPLRRISSGDIAGDQDPAVQEDLEGLDTLVIITGSLPSDPEGRTVDEAASIQALKAFVEGGGNLILTDEAIRFYLPKLTTIAPSAVTRNLSNAGHVNIDTFSDAYTQGVYPTASQTYYEVPLGYAATGNAPHWNVNRTALEGLGGTHVAHFGSSTNLTTLGRIPVGEGTIGVFGAVLPPAQESLHHFYGLVDYGVTVAGGQILNNMIRFEG